MRILAAHVPTAHSAPGTPPRRRCVRQHNYLPAPAGAHGAELPSPFLPSARGGIGCWVMGRPPSLPPSPPSAPGELVVEGGGFASVRFSPPFRLPPDIDALQLEARGDGRQGLLFIALVCYS
eukprot:scaffold18852_cov95-Isochrysis_galbana.AAC.1